MLQSIIERAGIATVSISLLMEITERVDPPRVLFIDRPLGYPLGEPNDPAGQRAILERALALLNKGSSKESESK